MLNNVHNKLVAQLAGYSLVRSEGNRELINKTRDSTQNTAAPKIAPICPSLNVHFLRDPLDKIKNHFFREREIISEQKKKD